MAGELGSAKSVVIVAVVFGCFAILWPKIFYPMFFGSSENRLRPGSLCCGLQFENDGQVDRLCAAVNLPDDLSACFSSLESNCSLDMATAVSDMTQKTHLTQCLSVKFKLTEDQISAIFRQKSRRNAVEIYSNHLRPERPPHLGGDFPHPSLRNKEGKIFYGEEGRQLKRTIDKELRPGPVPGMRPSMGGPGMQPQMQAPKGQTGSMGMLMPLYTVGIVIFFIYTVMKIMYKKNDDDVPAAKDTKTPARPGGYQAMNSEYLTKIQEQERNLLASMKKAAAIAAEAQRLQKIKEEETPKKIDDVKEEPIVVKVKTSPIKEQTALPAEPKKNPEDEVDEPKKTAIVGSGVEEIKASSPADPRDIEIHLLKQRLLETEKAMEKIVAHMTGIAPGLELKKGEVKENSSKAEADQHRETEASDEPRAQVKNVKEHKETEVEKEEDVKEMKTEEIAQKESKSESAKEKQEDEKQVSQEE